MLVNRIKASDPALSDQNEQPRKLSECLGQCVVLYFYPWDMTVGCTKQACVFAELYPQFRGKGAVVLGISKNNVASYKKFEEKYGLSFVLLSGSGKTVIQAYDVRKGEKVYDRASVGVVRAAYLIDEQDIIVKGFEEVKLAESLADMLGGPV